MAKDETNVEHELETPAGYNGSRRPDAKELAAPTKIYPGASKLGHEKGKGIIEGPGCIEGHGGYHE